MLMTAMPPETDEERHVDSAAWDARYAQHDLVWSATPNQFVVEHTAGLAPGRALDVASGEGRNAVWLARQGWDVVGVDFSPVAVDKARRLAAANGVEVAFHVGDVTEPGDVTGRFDLVVVAYLHLAAAPMAATLRRLAGAVEVGGRIVVVGHHVDNPDRGHGGPPDRAVLHDPGVVAAALVGLEVSVAQERARAVVTDDGERTAIDSVVVATRAGDAPR